MANILSGLKFFTDTLGVPYSNVPAAFSFRMDTGVKTPTVTPDSWAIFSASGILNPETNPNTFFSNFGTGSFQGNTYLELNKNFNLNNSTIFISYEKLRPGSEILLSSATGNNFNNYSGFLVGVNDANKLFFQYWNNVEGVFTFTYDGMLSNKNLIVINRTNSIVSLGRFNNNTHQIEAQEFQIYQGNFINSSNLYLGGSPTPITWSKNNLINFSGYIDRFYIFNDLIFTYADVLSSGMYTEPSGAAGIETEVCFTTGFISGSGFSYTGVTGVFLSGFVNEVTGITGFTQGVSGYSYTGITGYSGKSIGTFIDNCGVSKELFEQVPLSGLISGEVTQQVGLTGIIFNTGFTEIQLTGTTSGIQNVSVTGAVCQTLFEVTGSTQYQYDVDYLSSLSYKEISLLSEIKDSNDVVEVYSENFNTEFLPYNQNLIFDNFFENYFYIDKEYAANEILLFGNGQALIDSGFQLISQGYDTIRSPNLDYFITGTTIETNKFFGQQDDLFYDFFIGQFSAFILTTHVSGQAVNNVNFNDAKVFYNGQKLVSGIQYHAPNILNINLSNETGYFIIKKYNNFNYLSGVSGTLPITTNFNNSCSQVYFNGIRQKLNNNYLENSTFDLLSGNFKEPPLQKVAIYDNSEDFILRT
jgi:hypothetical protein